MTSVPLVPFFLNRSNGWFFLELDRAVIMANTTSTSLTKFKLGWKKQSNTMTGSWFGFPVRPAGPVVKTMADSPLKNYTMHACFSTYCEITCILFNLASVSSAALSLPSPNRNPFSFSPVLFLTMYISLL